MGKYTEFETRTQPWFDESSFKGFNFAIPMKTLVIYCVDPRASDIPQALVRWSCRRASANLALNIHSPRHRKEYQMDSTIGLRGTRGITAPVSPLAIEDTKRYVQDFDRVQKTATSDQGLFDQMTGCIHIG